ncbi:MAG: hypothetical protein ACHQK8_03730 [Bacteroidia bacterium]
MHKKTSTENVVVFFVETSGLKSNLLKDFDTALKAQTRHLVV